MAHALSRAASRLISTPGNDVKASSVKRSLDATRKCSARAQSPHWPSLNAAQSGSIAITWSEPDSGTDRLHPAPESTIWRFIFGWRRAAVISIPCLFEAMYRPEVYGTNKVRFELMKRLGYFVTESSEHNAEYSPYFIPHGSEQIARFDVPIDEYLRRCDGIVDEFERLRAFSKSDEPIDVAEVQNTRQRDHSFDCDRTLRVVYGNMPNRGAIANLPATAIAEAPTLVDRTGLHFTTVGELPPQLIGYMMPHVMQHELFIRAATEGRRDHVYQACMPRPADRSHADARSDCGDVR